MKNIISASRRTDIPAFYPDWFIKRLKEGFAYVKNPYSGKVSTVSLRPDSIHSIVLVSKNFAPLLKKIAEVEKVTKNLFFHFTITAVPKSLELNTPDYKSAIRDFIFISKRYSPGHIVWRFDPIVITDKLQFEHCEEAFRIYALLLKGATEDCFISFVEPYKKVIRNFEKYADERIIEPAEDKKREYARRLARIAEEHGMKLYACCNEELIGENVYGASCINGERLARLFYYYSANIKPAPTREGCGCARSVDIGSYDTCPHGCIYCYANSDKERAKESLKKHNPEWRGLGFDEGPEEAEGSLF